VCFDCLAAPSVISNLAVVASQVQQDAFQAGFGLSDEFSVLHV
jgi:hypothetical protein